MSNGILGFNSKSSYYKKTDVFLSPQQPRWVGVWVESDDDKRLWMPVLKEKYVKCRFKFHIASLHKFDDGVVADGCSRLISQFRKGNIELGESMIACLDSDYSYISGNYDNKNKSILLTDYAFGTYVHSKENLYLHSEGVAEIIERSLGEDLMNYEVNIERFTHDVSVFLYETFTHLISLYHASDIEAFDRMHCKFVASLKDSFSNLVIPDDLNKNIDDLMSDSFRDFCKELNDYIRENHSEDLVDGVCEFHSRSDICDRDTLSFIRGHDLYSILMPIYKSIENYVFSKKRDAFSQEHIPSTVRSKKLSELANKRVKIEQVICCRGDTTRNHFFCRVFDKLNSILS